MVGSAPAQSHFQRKVDTLSVGGRFESRGLRQYPVRSIAGEHPALEEIVEMEDEEKDHSQALKQTHQQRRESEFNSIQQFFFTQHSEAFSRSSIPRGSIVTRKKRNSTVVQQRHEAESFSVSSDSKFLYTIGKICARSGENIEEGLKAFNDFLLILDYFKTELDVQFRRKIHAKANYFIGMLFY